MSLTPLLYPLCHSHLLFSCLNGIESFLCSGWDVGIGCWLQEIPISCTAFWGLLLSHFLSSPFLKMCSPCSYPLNTVNVHLSGSHPPLPIFCLPFCSAVSLWVLSSQRMSYLNSHPTLHLPPPTPYSAHVFLFSFIFKDV